MSIGAYLTGSKELIRAGNNRGSKGEFYPCKISSTETFRQCQRKILKADGHALLSLKRANAERQWRIAEEQYKNNELLKARVIDFNKGGLIVDVSGIRGFVPISQILNLKREEVASGGENQETAAKLQSMKDKELRLKIIEINRALNRLILSERLPQQEYGHRSRDDY